MAGRVLERADYDYISNYRFHFMIGSGGESNTIGFSRVSGLSLEQSFEEVHEGGVNDRVHLFASPNAVAGTLVLERGAMSSETKLLQLRPGVFVGGCTITAMRKGKGAVVYEVDNAIISKWEIGELDAMGNSILVHKMEIKYYGLKVTANPQYGY